MLCFFLVQFTLRVNRFCGNQWITVSNFLIPVRKDDEQTGVSSVPCHDEEERPGKRQKVATEEKGRVKAKDHEKTKKIKKDKKHAKEKKETPSKEAAAPKAKPKEFAFQKRRPTAEDTETRKRVQKTLDDLIKDGKRNNPQQEEARQRSIKMQKVSWRQVSFWGCLRQSCFRCVEVRFFVVVTLYQ